MTDEYLFISDCHLDISKPEITSNLLTFLSNRASKARFLYILGDLFEVWLGDDDLSPVNQTLLDRLKKIAIQTKVFFLAGNRDFLLGEQTAKDSNFEIINEPYFLSLGGQQVALMHGDTLCTDDQDYQKFRQVVRDPIWKSNFLQKSITERQQIAAELRSKSAAAMANKTVGIMDVNQIAVEQCFVDSKADIIIHGHTHRPGIHRYANDKTRFVLGDWNPQASYLSWDIKDGFQLVDERLN